MPTEEQLIKSINAGLSEVAMSLYNLVRGINPNAGLCCLILGCRSFAEFPRFRDAWLSDDGTKLTILTRTGGGNRAEYILQNKALRDLPGYITDTDDDYDSTFARWLYNVPTEYHADTKAISKFMMALESGETTQGPRAMVDAMMIKYGEQPSKPTPKVTQDDPVFIAAWEAYDRLSNTLKAKLTATQ